MMARLVFASKRPARCPVGRAPSAFTRKQRGRYCALTLPQLQGRSTLHARRAVVRPDEGGFTLLQQRERSRAFTLLELLVVTGIIVLLLAALVPAVTSLSKSSGRKAAISNLLGGIEQARAQAIKSGQAAYVVFPTFTSGAQSTLDRYNYRSYAVFEDDAANPGNVKQLTAWKSFPIGVALRAVGTAALSNLADPAT